MTDKPKQPAIMSLIPVLYAAALWFYPVAPGGLGNLAAFAAWGFTCLSVLVLLIGLGQPAKEDKYRPLSAPAKWAIRVGVWGGIVWLAYHGAFVLAGLVAFSCVLALMLGLAQKQARAA